MRAVPTSTAPSIASAPPLSPVPDPRATKTRPSAWRRAKTRLSSSVVRGSTTAEGG